MRRASHRAAFAGALVAGALALGALAGCGSDGIDPPPGGEIVYDEESPAVDSLVAWAQGAREAWARGDDEGAAEAARLARAVFSGVWADLAAGSGSEHDARTSERLPMREDAALPGARDVRERLAALGLEADIEVAGGPVALWQVVLDDPTGSAAASTEFWAWPDPESPLGAPVLQGLPAKAPARARFGPDAVGELLTYARPDGVGLASAWTRPRGTGGIEVALLSRPLTGSGRATWRVTASNALPATAESLAFVPTAGVPDLLVQGARGSDPLFDECPTCPRVERRQRYSFAGSAWSLREESTEPTPYAAIVSFMHALREGGPEAALPYAAGPEVIEQARELGLERGPNGRLRAALGTDAMDRTQRFRRGGAGGSDGLEVTLDPRGEGWVVADLRPTRLVIE